MNLAKANSGRKVFTKPVIIILIGIGFLVLALILHPFDHVFKDYIQNSSLRKHTPQFFSFLINLIETFGKGDLIAILIVIIAAKGLRKSAVKITVTVLLMTMIVWCIKPTVQRERPNGKSVSFPSGDTATASAFFTSAAIEYPVTTPLFVISPAVAFVRVFKNYHYLSDVAAGLAIGIIAAGLSYYVKFKKLKLLEKMKPRIYFLAVIIMCLIMFVPDAIRGRGDRLDFMEFFAPSLFIWMFASYSRVFVFKHSVKQNFISNIFSIKRKCNLACYTFISQRQCNCTTVRVLPSVLAVFSLLAIVASWLFITNQGLLFSICGLFFGVITAIVIILKQNKIHGNQRTAIYTGINSVALLVFFFIVSFIPALLFSLT
jgi:membrane-associated phospholipid phosphatase